ncbi:MAG: phosphoglycerate mutase family protein [Chthoniobacterales bacterium]
MPKFASSFLTAFVLAGALAPALGEEPRIIFLVRHAERADAGGPAQSDPGLSQIGRARAATLATQLRDANIATIYSSEFKRTQQTAAPLAASLGIKVQTVPAKEDKALLARLKNGEGNAFVVGHSNTVPENIRALGVSTPVTIGESDYDDLFLVVLSVPPQLIRLHYR